MCLIIEVSTQFVYPFDEGRLKVINRHKKIAKEDIICYKALKKKTRKGRKFLSTPYKKMEVELDFHYYQEGKNIFDKFSFDQGTTCIEINRGLHSYKNWLDAKFSKLLDSRLIIYKAIIPKGSIYFDNDRNYASDNLIITSEKINFKECV